MPSSSIFLFGFVIVGVLGIVDESVVVVRLILKCCFCREYWMSSSCSYSSFKMKLLPTSFPRLSTSTSTSLRSFWGISEDYCNFLSRINMNIFLGKTRFEFWWLLWFRFLGLVFAPSKTAICLHLWERTLGILFIFAPSLSLSKLEIVLWENSLWIWWALGFINGAHVLWLSHLLFLERETHPTFEHTWLLLCFAHGVCVCSLSLSFLFPLCSFETRQFLSFALWFSFNLTDYLGFA